MNNPPRRGRGRGRQPRIVLNAGTPAGKNSSKKAAVDTSASRPAAPSGNERASPAATSTEEAGSAVDYQDASMSGTEASLPENASTPPETGSSRLREKLLAVRKSAPSSYNKSSPLKNASMAGNKAKGTAEIDLEPIKVVPAVDELISRYPELSQATSKAAVIDTILHSNVLNTNVVMGDIGTYPIDYTQIEYLANSILARSTTYNKVQPTKNEAILDTNLEDKNVDAKDEDPVAQQEEKVLSLFKVLSKKLNARFPSDPAADPITSAEEEEAIFRENAASLKLIIALSLSMFKEDGELHAEILKFDREEETLRLTKKTTEEARAKDATFKERPEETILRNMAFLAQDNPMSTMQFEEDYVERYSNDEHMAKMKHMLKPDGPLGRAYGAKQLQKHKDGLQAERAKQHAQWEAYRQNPLAGMAAGDACDAPGAPENDYFYTFGK